MSRKILIQEYICNLSAIRNITQDSIKPFPDFQVANSPTDDPEAYFLSWGDPAHKAKTGVMETGFCWDAVHIDTIGLYSHSSLNTPAAKETILNFTPPRSAASIVLNGNLPPSKYRQSTECVQWEGVVLALQNPHDRSIHRGSSTSDYFNFVESACKHYKNHLFLKLHPWNSGDTEVRFREIALRYGSQIGRVNHSVINNCRFVLVYNSTFVFDALLRGKRVVQFSPGYFYQCPGVHYSAFQFPDDSESNVEEGSKLCDFLLWRYCFHQGESPSKLADIIRLFANSNELFPLPEELSYGATILNNS